MKKHTPIFLPVILIIFALLVLPVDASQEKQNKNSNKNENARVQKIEARAVNESDPSITPSVVLSVSPVSECDPQNEWKNHGEYVSCVAKQKTGGESVSSAARSSIGKKQKTNRPEVSVSPSLTPSVSPTAAPSVSPSVTLTIAPTVEPSLTATPTAVPTVTIPTDQAQAVVRILERMLNYFKNLL